MSTPLIKNLGHPLRQRLFRVGAVLSAFLPLLSIVHAEQSAVIDPGKGFGKWDGWGTSLAWWAKVFGDRDDVADLLFTTQMVNLGGQSLPGLGLTIARYNAGASSWNEVDGQKMTASPAIVPYKQIEGFWLDGKSSDPQSKNWDWSVDKNQRAMLLKAKARGANWFELFSNSPMWWMCANHNPSGAKDGGKDNLPPENYEKFAIYMATIAKYAKDNWGISFTTVEPLNEPISNFWSANCRQEGCHFSHETQAAVLKLLRAELDKRGLVDTPISASDENTYDMALGTWNSFDSATKAVIKQINVHGYQGSKGRRDLLYQAAATAGKRLWNSEHGDEDASGLQMARCINLDLRNLHPTAWCYWQPIDRGARGAWGLMPGDLDRKTISPPNPKYFVLAHYSRHIRPGMTILNSGETNTVAAYDAAKRRLVIVALNDMATGTKSFDLSKFSEADGPMTYWMTELKGSARYEMHQGIKVVNKRLECELPADSITTFEIKNVSNR